MPRGTASKTKPAPEGGGVRRLSAGKVADFFTRGCGDAALRRTPAGALPRTARPAGSGVLTSLIPAKYVLPVASILSNRLFWRQRRAGASKIIGVGPVIGASDVSVRTLAAKLINRLLKPGSPGAFTHTCGEKPWMRVTP